MAITSLLCFPSTNFIWDVADFPWTNPDNLYLIDAILGEVFFASLGQGDTQGYYGWDPDPPTALGFLKPILGIKVHYYGAQETIQFSNIFTFDTALGFRDSGPLSDTKTTIIELFSGVPQEFTEGGLGDFWNFPVTPAAGNFGSTFSVFTSAEFNNSGNAVSAVDAIGLELFYNDSSKKQYIDSNYY